MLSEYKNEKRRRGKLIYICGPMFSGKSTELLRRAAVYAVHDANRVVALLNAGDTRNAAGAGGRAMFTHSGERRICERVRVVHYSGAPTAALVPADATHVLLDEAQMLDAETVDAVLWRELVLARGLHVTAAGLMFKGCWQRGPAHPELEERAAVLTVLVKRGRDASSIPELYRSTVALDAIAATVDAGCTATAMFPAAVRLNERADEVVQLRAVCACGAKTRFTACADPARQITGNAPIIGGADKYVALCGPCMELRHPVSGAAAPLTNPLPGAAHPETPEATRQRMDPAAVETSRRMAQTMQHAEPEAAAQCVTDE